MSNTSELSINLKSPSTLPRSSSSAPIDQDHLHRQRTVAPAVDSDTHDHDEYSDDEDKEDEEDEVQMDIRSRLTTLTPPTSSGPPPPIEEHSVPKSKVKNDVRFGDEDQMEQRLSSDNSDSQSTNNNLDHLNDVLIRIQQDRFSTRTRLDIEQRKKRNKTSTESARKHFIAPSVRVATNGSTRLKLNGNSNREQSKKRTTPPPSEQTSQDDSSDSNPQSISNRRRMVPLACKMAFKPPQTCDTYYLLSSSSNRPSTTNSKKRRRRFDTEFDLGDESGDSSNSLLSPSKLTFGSSDIESVHSQQSG